MGVRTTISLDNIISFLDQNIPYLTIFRGILELYSYDHIAIIED